MDKRLKVFCVFLAILFGMAFFSATSSLAASNKVLKFADINWDSVQVHNRIAGFILENGYGYKAEYLPGNTIPLFAGLTRGALDINMECWVENQQEALDKALAAGKVIDLGSNFPNSWQGWLVPTYMIKGDPARGIKPLTPDLKSIEDLSKYWEVFKDPEDPSKGIFFSCVPGWGCEKINDKKFKTYGLDKHYNIFPPGSSAALAGSIAAACKKGKPWFGYYWAPTPIMGKYDLTPIAEPAFDKKVWDKDYGCEYPPVKVNIVVHKSLPQKAPDVYEFLKKYETNLEICNKFLAYMLDNKDSKPADAAVWFLKNYESLWTQWVPAEVAQKVKAAL